MARSSPDIRAVSSICATASTQFCERSNLNLRLWISEIIIQDFEKKREERMDFLFHIHKEKYGFWRKDKL